MNDKLRSIAMSHGLDVELLKYALTLPKSEFNDFFNSNLDNRQLDDKVMKQVNELYDGQHENQYPTESSIPKEKSFIKTFGVSNISPKNENNKLKNKKKNKQFIERENDRVIKKVEMKSIGKMKKKEFVIKDLNEISYINTLGYYYNEADDKSICNCEGRVHALVNNCVSCGRIVCKFEGEGPCKFCGELVICSNSKKKLQNLSGKKANEMYEKLVNEKDNPKKFSQEAFNQAIIHRNRLLEYDRTCSERTRVIDDQNDYYTSSNKWLTNKHRDELREVELLKKEKENEIHSNFKLNLNIQNNSINVEKVENKELMDLKEIMTRKRIEEDEENRKNIYVEMNPYIESNSMNPMPKFIREKKTQIISSEKDGKMSKMLKEEKIQNKTVKLRSRLQGESFIETFDFGLHVFLPQPLATDVVDGKSSSFVLDFVTSHRGLLWIAANDEIENFSKENNQLDYVKSSLIGCVNVDESNVKDGNETEMIIDYQFRLKSVYKLKMVKGIQPLDKYVHRVMKRALLNNF
ncbi:hypothetical protein SNEBB_002375 [Seison nebaliae]|nr:hypothetical protein SNEBB_002375 [Seison nebaliae]